MALTQIDDRGLKTPIDLIDNEKIRLGTGNDLELYHDGSNSYLTNSTGALHIRNDGIYFKNAAGSENYIDCSPNAEVSLFYDNSKKLETTSEGILVSNSSSPATFKITDTSGSGYEGYIQMRGNDMEIRGSSGQLEFYTGSEDGASSTLRGRFASGGNFQINNDAGKIELGTSQDLQIYHDGSNSNIKNATGWLNVSAGGSGFSVGNGDFSENLFKATNNGGVELYYDNVQKINTNASGVDIGTSGNACHLMLFDGGEARFGTGQDLLIKHTSTNSLIKHEGTGDLYIDSYNKDIYIRSGDGNTSVETAIDCQNNGSVNLYHSGSLRAYTGSNGFQVYKASSDDVEFRLVNTQNTTAGATNTILSEHDARTTAKIVFGRNNDANDFSASAGSTQGDIQFFTTASGTTTKRAIINNTGYFHADGDSGSFVDCSSNLHAFRSSTSNWALRAISSHASTPYGVHAYFNNSDPDTGNYPFFQGQDQTGTKFRVQSNGNVENHDNSYGSISDVKLKENIVDAGSQWEDIKAIKVRNFNFKASKSKKKLLGVVAQELETTSPGLVVETPDEDLDHNDLGTTTKSVRYSILYMKAIKALQEAITKIETLETKVAALEAK